MAPAARVTPTASAVVAVPLYGEAHHAREALEGLLRQAHRPVAVVVVDDGGGSREHLQQLLARDEVHYVRNAERLGLVGNWRRAFRIARDLHPGAEYFAWASDHDICHPRWLGSLSQALATDADAVLAYPDSAVINATRRLRPVRRTFETRGQAGAARRLTEAYWGMAPGYAVYGLYRASALERVGAFPAVLFPDRFVLAQLSLLGTFVRVPEMLWYRRKEERFSLGRQRRSLFGPRTPLYARFPWWASHLVAFPWALVVRGRPCRSRREGLRMSIVHARACSAWAYNRWRRRIRRRVRAFPLNLARSILSHSRGAAARFLAPTRPS